MPRKKVKVVCVGTGWVTIHRHIPALKADPRVEIVAVVDRDRSKAKAVAAKLGIPRHGADIDEEWMQEVECATVGTPPATHREIVTRLLDLGLNILCEKPLATSASDAKAMVDKARQAGRTLCVVHNFQFSAAMTKGRRLIRQGRLGQIQAIHAVQMSNPSRRLPEWYPSLRGGLFYDESPHLLYLLRALIGELALTDVHGVVDRSFEPNHVEHLDAGFDANGAWVRLLMDFKSPISEWHLIVQGSEGLFAADLFRDIGILLPNDGAHSAPAILRTSALGFWRHWSGVATSGVKLLFGRLLYGNVEVVRRFIDATIEGTEAEGVSADDGLAVVETIDEILDHLDIER